MPVQRNAMLARLAQASLLVAAAQAHGNHGHGGSVSGDDLPWGLAFGLNFAAAVSTAAASSAAAAHSAAARSASAPAARICIACRICIVCLWLRVSAAAAAAATLAGRGGAFATGAAFEAFETSTPSRALNSALVGM